ncbi:MAG: hypothetical protein ABSH49_27360 [Bryobacteraceae bacterium]
MPDDPTEKPLEKLAFTRDEDFVSLYANNVQYEPSVWDLKMVFGELDQSKGPSAVEQHTAITLSWPEAKIAAYFMLLHIVGHQARNGFIQLHNSVIPPRPDPEGPTVEVNDKDLVRYFAWVHEQFFSGHPYLPPTLTGDPAKPPE